MHLEFLKRNVLGYVCNPSSSRERDAASRGHTSGIPASGCFIPEADAGSTARAFMLPGRLRHPPVPSRPSVGKITHVFRVRSRWGRSKRLRTQRLVPSRNWGYIRNLRHFFFPKGHHIVHNESPGNEDSIPIWWS